MDRPRKLTWLIWYFFIIGTAGFYMNYLAYSNPDFLKVIEKNIIPLDVQEIISYTICGVYVISAILMWLRVEIGRLLAACVIVSGLLLMLSSFRLLISLSTLSLMQ